MEKNALFPRGKGRRNSNFPNSIAQSCSSIFCVLASCFHFLSAGLHCCLVLTQVAKSLCPEDLAVIRFLVPISEIFPKTVHSIWKGKIELYTQMQFLITSAILSLIERFVVSD